MPQASNSSKLGMMAMVAQTLLYVAPLFADMVEAPRQAMGRCEAAPAAAKLLNWRSQCRTLVVLTPIRFWQNRTAASDRCCDAPPGRWPEQRLLEAPALAARAA
jgi:hypothetical protein